MKLSTGCDTIHRLDSSLIRTLAVWSITQRTNSSPFLYYWCPNGAMRLLMTFLPYGRDQVFLAKAACLSNINHRTDIRHCGFSYCQLFITDFPVEAFLLFIHAIKRCKIRACYVSSGTYLPDLFALFVNQSANNINVLSRYKSHLLRPE